VADKEGKTEAPTPKRRRDARKKGQVAKSVDVGTWMQVLVAVTMIRLVVSRGQSLLTSTMTEVRSLVAAPDLQAGMRLFGASSLQALVVVAPMAAAMCAVAVTTTMAQTRGLVSKSKLKPEFSMLNPFKGIKRLFSKLVLWEGGKTLVKFAVFSWVGWRAAQQTSQSLIGEPTTLGAVIATIGDAVLRLVRNLAVVGLLLAAVDWVFQRRQLMKQLKMSKEEIKQEGKEQEGNAEMKGARRRRQLEISRNRMLSDVRTASAVIVNPTHYAVAVRYSPGSGAPKVIAAGVDALAARIKAEATTHRVPIVRDPPLARALHGACDIGDEIPTELYEAVARVLAFVMQLRQRVTIGGEHTMPGGTTLGTAQLPLAAADRDAARARRSARKRERRHDVRTARAARPGAAAATVRSTRTDQNNARIGRGER
jgi:flagellar biosynthesis protein FlhB